VHILNTIFNTGTLRNVIAMVILLGVLIVIHEFGHFIMAKLFKVKVKIFSVGFGKKLFGKQWGETEYRLSAFPLGGYVALMGEEGEEANSDDPGNFNNKPRWQRFIILVMGAVFNIILAIILFTAVNMTHKKEPVWKTEIPVVGWIDKSSPAFVADFQQGDKIISFDGERIKSWDQLHLLTVTNPTKKVNIVVERNGSLVDLQVTLTTKGKDNSGYLGIFPKEQVFVSMVQRGSPAEKGGLLKGDLIYKINKEEIVKGISQCVDLIKNSDGDNIRITVIRNKEEVKLNIPVSAKKGERVIGIGLETPYNIVKLDFTDAFKSALSDTYKFTELTFTVLGKLIKGQMSVKSISGPVDIARISGQAASAGFIPFIYVMALISLQLGIFNLLPVPMLDGGHITILAIEGIRRKDLSMKLKEKIMAVGFFLLMSLMILVIISDIIKNL
jgi:regulator of sigma E protease